MSQAGGVPTLPSTDPMKTSNNPSAAIIDPSPGMIAPMMSPKDPTCASSSHTSDAVRDLASDSAGSCTVRIVTTGWFVTSKR